MSRYYFYNEEDERCVTLPEIKDMMADDKLTEKEVVSAKILTGEGFFYCREYGEVGEVGNGCGKECKSYNPRNGKNGRCTKSVNCYEHGEKILIKL